MRASACPAAVSQMRGKLPEETVAVMTFSIIIHTENLSTVGLCVDSVDCVYICNNTALYWFPCMPLCFLFFFTLGF